MKKRRILILSLLTLLLIVGIPAGIVMSEYRHIQVNRALIAAVKADDTNKALTALNAGAEADYPRQPSRPIWIQWLDRIAGLQVSSNIVGPSLWAQAVQHNNTVVVKALLEKGATDVQGLLVSRRFSDTPEESFPLLAFAAEAGNLVMCHSLVEHGAVDGSRRKFALTLAAAHRHSDVIRFLFQHGATFDTPSDDGYSLRAAVQSGDLESVRLLLAHGADATYEGRWGSVLSDAVYGGNLAMVKLIVEAGADVNGQVGFAKMLQCAAEAGDAEIVRYLIKKGAKVNAKCAWNRTPLMEAVKENHTAVVKLLLEHGADWRPKEAASGDLLEEHGPDWRPNNEAGNTGFTKGDTALRLAQRKGNTEIVQMLKQAGAKQEP